MANSFTKLSNNLNLFIKKYYFNSIFQGLLILVSSGLLFFLVFSLLEYLVWLNTFGRGLILLIYSIFLLFILYFFVAIPLLRLFHLYQGVDSFQAAALIKKHFPEMEDRLINTLELRNLMVNHDFSTELVAASIEQKAALLSIFNFSEALPKERVRHFLYFSGGIIVIYLLIGFFKPAVYTQGSYRLINYQKEFYPELPFQFELINEDLNVEKGADFDFQVRLYGSVIPAECYLQLGTNKYLMLRKDGNIFSFVFKAVNNSLSFKLNANEFSFASFKLNVRPSPQIKDLLVSYYFPEYTRLNTILNQPLANIEIPVGTKIVWNIKTVFTDSLYLNKNGSAYSFQNVQGDFLYSCVLNEGFIYSLTACNTLFRKSNIVEYSITAIPDLFPEIRVLALEDSLKPGLFYYKGFISDDYGFSNLQFHYFYEKGDSSGYIQVPFEKGSRSQDFYFSVDLNSLDLSQSGLIYYFEVCDNDNIAGVKCTKSESFDYKSLSFKEVEEIRTEISEDMEKSLFESMMLADELKREMEVLNKSLLSEDLSSFERSKMVENIQRKQTKLESLLKKLKENNDKSNSLLNNLNKDNQEILEAQKEIEKLFKELMNDEIKKMMEELKKLSEEFDKNKLKDVMDKMKLSYDDLKKQLDRDLELLKRYKVEEKLNTIKNKLEELSDNQNELSKELLNIPSDTLLKNKIQEDKNLFIKLEEHYNETLKQNEKLLKPFDLENFEQDFQDINEQLENAFQESKDDDNGKASKSSKKAADKLKQLAEKFAKMQSDNQMNQNAENYEDLKMVLDNILKFSFQEETLIQSLTGLRSNDPDLKEISRQQKKLSDDFIVIRDSLFSISKRNPKIASIVDKEISSIIKDIQNVLNNIEMGNISSASVNCQYIMTSANNLALILSESIEEMDSMMQSNGSGSGQCKKKKPGKPGMDGLKGQQESFKNQLQKMIDQIKSGQQPGKGNKSSEQIGKMLAEQELMQQQLQELINSSGIGSKASEILKDVQKFLDDNRRDLLFNNFNQQFLQRQQLITTRLLEAEKAEKERELDEQRESKENKLDLISNPKSIFEYNKENIIFNENLLMQDFNLNLFYKEKHKQYIQNLNSMDK